MNVEKQTGTVDCALYAIAMITALWLKEDPIAIIFNQAELRPHFINILETKTITKFPILKVKHRITDRISYTQQCLVYCICRLPDDGREMVGCDVCHEWFHLDCLGLTEAPKTDIWYCSQCQKLSM